jgi:hypothetical protein
LLEPLGHGGMGVVWKARQTKLNRLAALKMVLGEQWAGSKELIRFLAEAEAAAAVKHPHVVQVYEYGEADGRPFLAMEYLAATWATCSIGTAGSTRKPRRSWWRRLPARYRRRTTWGSCTAT